MPAAAFGGRKVRALLRMLAVRRGRLVPLDVLAEWLWPDRAPADPPANLQVLVNRIRRAVGRPDLVVTGTSGYALTDAPWCVVDTETLPRRAAPGRRDCSERAALAVYRTALVGGDVEPLAEDRYAGWAEPFRDEIARARQAAWERAADLALTAAQPTVAVEWAAAAARAEPLREVAVLTLVRALAAAGDRAAALARYDAYRRLLREELGLDPSPVAAELQARLLRAEPGPAARRPAALADRGVRSAAVRRPAPRSRSDPGRSSRFGRPSAGGLCRRPVRGGEVAVARRDRPGAAGDVRPRLLVRPGRTLEPRLRPAR